MAKLYDMAQMTVSGTPGTGTITLLAGAVVDGTTYQTFAQAGVATGDVISYRIRDGANWEVGRGTYTAAGLTLTRGALYSMTGGTQGTGAISASSSSLVAIASLAEDILGFAESVSWIAGTNPHQALIFTNNTGRTVTITGVVGTPQVVNGVSTTVDVYMATSAQTALNSTKISTTTSFNAAGTVGSPQVMLSGGNVQMVNNSRLGIWVTGTPTWDTSIASITVYMQ